MLVVDSLKAEASKLANARNAEVIIRAFRGPQCAVCRYPPMALRFENLLGYYAHLQITLTKAKRWADHRAEFCRCRICMKSLVPQLLCNRVIWAEEIQQKVDAARRAVKALWPCENCIKRFNPTSRLVHRDKNYPERGYL